MLTALTDRLIHKKLLHPALTHSRAKNFIGCCIISIIIVPEFAILFYYLNEYTTAIAVLLYGVAVISAIFVIKIIGSLSVAREILIIAAYLTLTWTTYIQGGILSPPGYWLVLLPIIAIFLGGLRAGLNWVIIATFTLLTFYLLQMNHVSLPLSVISNVLLLQFTCILSLMGILIALIYFFELGKIEGFARLSDSLASSQQKSRAILQINHELQILSNRINAILTAAADGIVTTDDHGIIMTINQAVINHFGYDTDDLLGKNINILFDQKNIHQKKILYNDIDEDYSSITLTGIRKNNTLFPLEISISKTHFENDQFAIYIIRDISERVQSEIRLTNLAYYDQLTGLPNRILFEILLENSIDKAKVSNKIISLIFINLDHFKNVNNSLGHDVGDSLLADVCRRFKKILNENIILARHGGDEFTMLLEEAELSDSFAKNLLTSFKDPFIIKNHTIPVTASIGIATFPNNGMDAATLIKNADIAMYQAKTKGRNNIQYFDEAVNQHFLSQLILENELQSALRNNEFHIVYQPQYDTFSNKIVGIEALIRWRNPSLGLIKPDEFIPTAEKIGIITQIGEWILKEACMQFRKWQEQQLIPFSTRIAINLSVIQIKQDDLLQRISDILEEVRINPLCVDLELTESMIMDDPANALIILKKLTQLGIQIVIDDFGTGYSSLSRLKTFPVHLLKIDKTFLYQIPQNEKNVSIIKSIIQLGHELGLKIVAEGVETNEQLQFLKINHCDYIQGFYFSRPLETNDMTALLKRSVDPVSSLF